MPQEGGFRSVALGSSHVCAVRENGSVSCWATVVNTWTMTPPAGSFDTIAMAWGTACGLRASGAVECWGTPDTQQQTPSAGSYVQVATGSGRACALDSSGGHLCWGDEPSLNQDGPWPPWLFNRIALGPVHTCGILLDASVACWGNPYNDEYGALRQP
jgi:alpha-tubulin suppressor-like RCC1 family protein